MQFKKDDKLEIKSTAHSRYRCQYISYLPQNIEEKKSMGN